MYRLSYFTTLLLVLSIVSCSSTTNTSSGASADQARQDQAIPDNAYDYYSGDDNYGDHYCKVQTFTHTATGKKVTLIGMIHTADETFYRKVDAILDRQDIILAEGIHGKPSFGVQKHFLNYVFYTMRRFTYLQKLTFQGQELKDRDNIIIADMSSDEFAAQGSAFTPLIQVLSLPVMMAVTEPYYLVKRSQITTLSLFTETAAHQQVASLRHLTMRNLGLTDKPSSILLPGIINSRNALLLKELEKQINQEKVHSIALPWGAAHLPSLETDLIRRGYAKDKDFQWLPTVAVDSYLKNPAAYTSSTRHTGIPYLIDNELSATSQSCGILLSTIKHTRAKNFNRFSLLYGDLLDSMQTANGYYFSLLPKIYGKPLLFDYANQATKKRYRYLWFFSCGAL